MIVLRKRILGISADFALVALRPEATILYLRLKSRGTDLFLIPFYRGGIPLKFAESSGIHR